MESVLDTSCGDYREAPGDCPRFLRCILRLRCAHDRPLSSFPAQTIFPSKKAIAMQSIVPTQICRDRDWDRAVSERGALPRVLHTRKEGETIFFCHTGRDGMEFTGLGLGLGSFWERRSSTGGSAGRSQFVKCSMVSRIGLLWERGFYVLVWWEGVRATFIARLSFLYVLTFLIWTPSILLFVTFPTTRSGRKASQSEWQCQDLANFRHSEQNGKA